MNGLNLSDLYAAAARATINERCATAYLHDVRGSMQALFSAVELLGRSARHGGGDLERVEKACALARRAITFHEKATLETLQILTLQDAARTAVEVGALVNDVVHFLRNEASNKEVTVKVSGKEPLRIAAERAKLQTALIGLLAAAIDATPSGSELPVSIDAQASFAVISIGSDAGCGTGDTREVWDCATEPLLPNELTLRFARQLLESNAGRLEIDAHPAPRGSLRLFYPLMVE